MTSRLQARLLAQRALFQRLQNSKKRGKEQAGFTLIELLIVVVIIGILAAIALPAFLNQQGRARINAAQNAVMAAARACAAATVTSDTYTSPGNVTMTPGCTAGTEATFTSSTTDFNVTTAAVATMASTGEVSLTQCAATNGWAAGTAPGCVPTRS